MPNNLTTIKHYQDYIREFDKLDPQIMHGIARHMCRTDLFFLIWWACGRHDIANQWLLNRCKEVEQDPNGYLDLWARDHYKSTIITYGKSIQDILSSHGDDPLPEWGGREVTIGIFSCTRPIAKGFLRQIKIEFEDNKVLKSLFPDILWENPFRDAPKWSEDDGLIVKRKSNPKEATIEAWGVVEGQPTSKHFLILNYDDLITLGYVTTPQMIGNVLDAWEKSTFLGAEGGYQRYIGTRYHFNDAYGTMISRGAAKPRIYPATIDGKVDGEPVLHSRESIADKRKKLGIYSFASQMLLDPKADSSMGFKPDWLRFYKKSDGCNMNKYILVDPANSKKKSSDYTYMEVVGLAEDQNYYTLDMVRDRLSLTERGDALFHLHRKWRPNDVGYEQYGMQADIDYLNDRMSRENYRFNIIPLGGKLAKEDRISKLIPIFEQGRWYIPESLFKNDYEGKYQDLTEIFISEEYNAYPVSYHDDMLDGKARILEEDLGAIFPRSYEEDKPERYKRQPSNGGSSWAA